LRVAHNRGLTYAGFVVHFPRVVEGHSSPHLEMAIAFSFTTLTLVATFSAPWWVAHRNRRFQTEVGEWRLWLEQQQL
jgi:hypothetical protein